MRRCKSSVAIAVSTLLLISFGIAQQTSTISVPNLIRYGGALKDAQGSPVASATVGVTFAIYKQQDGGAPIWMETQNVTTDAGGNYSVLLGSTTDTGLPGDLFSQQEQRWLGVETQGEAEQPRVLLVSVPYAFKAHDAETLGGRSVSDFVLANNKNSSASSGNAGPATTSTASTSSPAKAGSKTPAVAAGPTNFSGSTTDQIVKVTQGGTGAGITASASTNAIYGLANGSSGNVYGVQGVATGTGGVALFGNANNPSGGTFGIKGSSSSTSGTGMRGLASASTGNTIGVSSQVNSPQGTAAIFNNAGGGKIISGQSNGVERFAVDGSGNITAQGSVNANGLSGTTSAPSGVGLTGNATNTAGSNTGVLGETASIVGLGVSGMANATTGQNAGVYGQSNSNQGWGVYGFAATTTGTNFGVEGNTSSSGQGSAGVLGYEGATTGHVFGLHGITTSTGDYSAGVAGNANGASGLTWGVNGQTSSTTTNVAGVHGSAIATTGQIYGVAGDTTSTTNYAAGVSGYEGATTGQVFGVTGGTSSTSNGAAGVNGSANATSGVVSGVAGQTNSATDGAAGVNGYAGATSGNVFGVIGSTASPEGNGVVGTNTSLTGGDGVYGSSSATSGTGYGVFGQSASGAGVIGVGTGNATGVNAIASGNQAALFVRLTAASSPTQAVVINSDSQGGALSAFASTAAGSAVFAENTGGGGLFNGNNGTTGVFYVDTDGNGYYAGNLHVGGTLSKGGGSFQIDDPLDPENKTLSHSFVESPDMMNVYNGNVITDKRGIATVVLPDYFEALNRDFRYQLTVIGKFSQAIIVKEISQNRFTIKTDKPTVKVSWQVTGIRQDAWANAHRIPVEEPKPDKERGTYLHPDVYGAAGRTNAMLQH